MLFHYHFWTPYVEETERFYIEHGFRITQRIGKFQGDYQSFNPPLNWDDFRDKDITFRIIEARKGAINITFGFGKKVMFDHIGFLVNANEHDEICNRAREMNLNVNSNDRRTFIGTPYGFRIELQKNMDAIDELSDVARIVELELSVQSEELEKKLFQLLNNQIANVHTVKGNMVTINKAVMKGVPVENQTDPNGVQIAGRI